jgi:hypothetical protein
MALHGNQENRFLSRLLWPLLLPLYIFCGDHVLCARLRPSNLGPAVGSAKEIGRVVQQIRRRWPDVRIIVRGNSGFCVDELMTWCEQNGMDFLIGMARNKRLETLVADALGQAQQQFAITQTPARVFVEFEHETRQRLVEQETTSGGQSRAHRRQIQSAFCGDLARRRNMEKTEPL